MIRSHGYERIHLNALRAITAYAASPNGITRDEEMMVQIAGFPTQPGEDADVSTRAATFEL